MKKIYWKLILNSSKELAVASFLNKICILMNFQILEKKPYWKDLTKFEVVLEQFINFENSDVYLIEIIHSSLIFSNEWHYSFDGNGNKENCFILSGISNESFKFQEIFWVNFEIISNR